MTLTSGTRLGPYEIVSAIGAGGMGEVYKARDTRLERTVAIKVLPQRLSSSPEVRQRFEREAKTISQLSHPHICALYDVGREGETEYLVMEYLEGETLSERLVKGALPLEQTLRYGVEISDALDKAHRQGIVHRDLKPGNVMLTKSGVKLLDFGLAKAMAPVESRSGLTSVPTVAGPPNLTQEGTILGTFQYMAPEQLEGRDADARTDIFAFGATLYEMATGRKAFSGASQASLISSIMKEDPAPISTLQPMSPPALDRAVRTCLAKDPEDRWQSAHDVAGELKWIAEGSHAGATAPVSPRRRHRERVAWGIAALFFLGMLAFALAFLRRPPPAAARPVRFQILLSGGGGFYMTGLAVSPDGSQLAFVAPAQGTNASLWLRPLDALESHPLAGTEGATQPFWSPDGRSLGFFSGGSLKTIELAGGLSKTLATASGDTRGGAWGRDGNIVFAPGFQSALMSVPAGGGASRPATELDASRKEQTHRWPSFLPDGRRFLYFSSKGSGEEPGEIFVGSLDGGPPKHVMSSASLALYAPPEYLVYDRGRNLVAQPFDPVGLKRRGTPVSLGQVHRIAEMSGFRPFSVSTTGVLAFQPADTTLTNRIVWLDRSGRELGTVAGDAGFYAPRLSRDGSRLLVTRWDRDTTIGDIWIFDLSRNVGSRFTFDPADDVQSLWSGDGKNVFFSSSREGIVNLYQARADRSGSDEILLRSEAWKIPDDVTPDGRHLLYETLDAKGRIGLWVLPMSGPRTPKPFSVGEFSHYAGQFSPNGRFVAYASGESGREEVYVTAFPGPGGRWQVSTGGGGMPRWSADGRELFYYGADGSMMAASVTTEPAFEASTPTALFKVRFTSAPDRQYEVSPDGKRFLVNVLAGAAEPTRATLVLNWTAGLEKK